MKLSQVLHDSKWSSYDAKEIYPSIKTYQALDMFELILSDGTFIITENVPVKEMLAILEIVMKSNVFMFGDMWFRQSSGKAIETPSACNYAIIYVGYFEKKILWPIFKKD